MAIFLLFVGRKSIVLLVARFQFVATGPEKIKKISQWIKFSLLKWDRDFALAGEIINDHKFSFYATFLTRTR